VDYCSVLLAETNVMEIFSCNPEQGHFFFFVTVFGNKGVFFTIAGNNHIYLIGLLLILFRTKEVVCC
jgi:hypothetical protein